MSTKSPKDIFEVFNGIFYVAKTGCQWNMLPRSYPSWRTCYNFFRKWTDAGIFVKIPGSMPAVARRRLRRKPDATVVVVDSQNVRSGLPQSEKGIDGGKKIKGIKRHVCVDSQGLPMNVAITPANVYDSQAADGLIRNTILKYQDIKLIKADNGYCGRLVELLKETLDITLECVKSNFDTSEFKPISGRWVVERTFAWLDNFRRLCRNYERYLQTAQGMTFIGCVMFLLRFFT